jgi:hypothetical protein
LRTALKRATAKFGAATAVLLLVPLAAAGCGGDDDDNAADPPGTNVARANSAKEMVPDLSALGFRPASEQLPALETGNSHIVLFENPSGTVPSLRLEIALAQNAEAAQAQFVALADALRNPPPGLFGPDAKQTDGTPVYQADQSRSYKTDKPDKEGTVVFSDIHRMGRAVVIMYTIGQPGSDSEKVREQVAEMLAAKAPR